MHHQIATVLLQSLPKAEYVTVAENGEDTLYEFGFDTVYQQVLVVEKSDQRLCHGQLDLTHFTHPFIWRYPEPAADGGLRAGKRIRWRSTDFRYTKAVIILSGLLHTAHAISGLKRALIINKYIFHKI